MRRIAPAVLALLIGSRAFAATAEIQPVPSLSLDGVAAGRTVPVEAAVPAAAAVPPPGLAAPSPAGLEQAGPAAEAAIPAAQASGETSWTVGAQRFDGAAPEEGGEPPATPAPKKQPEHTLPVEQQLANLMEEYHVPPAERALRRRLTLEGVDRIRTGIGLRLDPGVTVEFGPWWLTSFDLANPRNKKILIPLKDIFLRAVDRDGVEEAVGANLHEMAHYSISRFDLSSPLTAKYAKGDSPKANNLLYQAIEDTRINTWSLGRTPGDKPYFDAIYEAEWPEDLGRSEQLKADRKARLAGRRPTLVDRSTLLIKQILGQERRWMPPHVQYANNVVYYWRHRKPAPFLTDPDALAAFEKTRAALDRVRLIHPQPIGGVLTEPMKDKASLDALQAIDVEIFPDYAKLIKKSKDQLDQMRRQGDEVAPSQGGGAGQGDEKDILGDLDRDLADDLGNHGHAPGDEARRNGWTPKEGDGAPKPGQSGVEKPEPGKSWLERRNMAIDAERARRESATNYERYRLRANELGLIGNVDGVIKKLLLPTKHSRLSRTFFHDGDEPDMNKYYDDAAQGRFDTPIMRRWNRRIRRSAKISLVLDISGSMGELTEAMTSPLDYAFLGIVSWIEVCQKNGLDFEVMLYDHDQTIPHEFGKPVNRAAKDHILAEILAHNRGSTAIGAAFKKALDRIIPQRATHRFVVFATDEGHNTGEHPEVHRELAKKNKIVTIAMVIGADTAGIKSAFDHAVRVEEPRQFPGELLKVLKLAIRSILGPAAAP